MIPGLDERSPNSYWRQGRVGAVAGILFVAHHLPADQNDEDNALELIRGCVRRIVGGACLRV